MFYPELQSSSNMSRNNQAVHISATLTLYHNPPDFCMLLCFPAPFLSIVLTEELEKETFKYIPRVNLTGCKRPSELHFSNPQETLLYYVPRTKPPPVMLIRWILLYSLLVRLAQSNNQDSGKLWFYYLLYVWLNIERKKKTRNQFLMYLVDKVCLILLPYLRLLK